jgi:hypothetical protein
MAGLYRLITLGRTIRWAVSALKTERNISDMPGKRANRPGALCRERSKANGEFKGRESFQRHRHYLWAVLLGEANQIPMQGKYPQPGNKFLISLASQS